MSAVIEQERPANLRPYADYSLEQKAEVLALVEANRGNVDKTARETNIPHQTIRFWLANSDRFSNLQSVKQVELAQIAEDNARRLGSNISTMDLSEVPLNHQATAFGIMVDKMQLLRNQPTSIVENTNSDSLTIVLQQVITSLDSTS